MGFAPESPVWLAGYWGFDPEEDGNLGFTVERDRKRHIVRRPQPEENRRSGQVHSLIQIFSKFNSVDIIFNMSLNHFLSRYWRIF